MLIHKIDELTQGDHHHIDSNSKCFYFFEYPSGDAKENRSNPHYSYIHNFKKGMDRRHRPEWRYKIEAINKTVQIFTDFFVRQGSIEKHTLVPIPPSKTRNDPLYDPRMTKVLERVKRNLPLADVRDLLTNKQNLNSHQSAIRPSIAEIENNYIIDENLLDAIRPNIILFDDVLTSGAHFCASKNKILSVLPRTTTVRGIFIARRVLPDPFDEFDNDIDWLF